MRIPNYRDHRKQSFSGDLRIASLRCHQSKCTVAHEIRVYLFIVNVQAGHSILARVQGFEHYFYYPAPPGISSRDLEPLCRYVNVSPIPTSLLNKLDPKTCTIQNALNPPTSAVPLPLSSISSIDLRREKTAPPPVGEDIPYLRIYLSRHHEIGRVKDTSSLVLGYIVLLT